MQWEINRKKGDFSGKFLKRKVQVILKANIILPVAAVYKQGYLLLMPTGINITITFLRKILLASGYAMS
jgi:hypothetical protein